MKFTKMHGCGNDYVYVNGFEEKIKQTDKSELVKRISDRHFGVGSDGVIFINPSDQADFEMEMWNADGTRAEMCGNGIRCVAKYVYDKGMTQQHDITVISAGNVKYLTLTTANDVVKMVRVNMGKPELLPEKIPVQPELSGTLHKEKKSVLKMLVGYPILVQDKEYQMTCVSMGNPHAVVFLDELSDLDIHMIGPSFEKHPCFPKRTNTEFIKVIDRSNIQMRVWERGTGETLACGTGCCAAVVASVLNGLTDNKVTVKLLGGELFIEWDREENLVYMTGPAETVFEGNWQLQ